MPRWESLLIHSLHLLLMFYWSSFANHLLFLLLLRRFRDGLFVYLTDLTVISRLLGIVVKKGSLSTRLLPWMQEATDRVRLLTIRSCALFSRRWSARGLVTMMIADSLAWRSLVVNDWKGASTCSTATFETINTLHRGCCMLLRLLGPANPRRLLLLDVWVDDFIVLWGCLLSDILLFDHFTGAKPLLNMVCSTLLRGSVLLICILPLEVFCSWTAMCVLLIDWDARCFIVYSG